MNKTLKHYKKLNTVFNEVSNEEQILTELLSIKRYLFVNKK